MTATLAASVSMSGEHEHVTATHDFDALYRNEFPRLVGALHLYCGDLELAHDFVQEAMSRAYRDWNRVRKSPTPSAWVYRVAINLATSWFRRVAVARRADRGAGRNRPRVHIDPDTGLHMAIRQAIAALPPRQRQAIVLRYVADLAVEDVARIMRCAPGTVKALTSQARETLRASRAIEGEDER